MKSCISKTEIKKGEDVKATYLREPLFNLIKSEYPEFSEDCYISLEELNRFRRLYMASLISQEKGEMEDLDQDVMSAIENNSILSENIEEDIEGKFTLGQRMADKIASFGGSWSFIANILRLYFDLDVDQHMDAGNKALRPLSFYTAELDSLLYCSNTGSNNHDEPEQERAEGQEEK